MEPEYKIYNFLKELATASAVDVSWLNNKASEIIKEIDNNGPRIQSSGNFGGGSPEINPKSLR